MINEQTYNRFAAFAGDRLVALVADGLPEWDDAFDVTSVPDATAEANPLRDLEAVWRAEFDRLAADESASEDDLRLAAEHVRAVCDEAARRLAAAQAEPEGDPDPAADPAAGLANEPEADPEPEGEPAPTRDELLAQLRAGMAPEPAPVVMPDPGTSREDLVAASAAGAAAAVQAALPDVITAATEAAVQAVTASSEALLPAEPRRAGRAADLSRFRPGSLAPLPSTQAAQTAAGERAFLNAELVTTADIPNIPMGTPITDRAMLVEAFSERLGTLGNATGVSDEKVNIASMRIAPPAERDLRGLSGPRAWAEARKKVQEVMAATPFNEATIERALTASGGLAAPVAPYYEQLVIAQNDRPVQAANPSFVMDRGGIKLVLPPSIGSISNIVPTGQFSDGVTNTDTSLVSATAAFTASDVGSGVVGAGIPAGTIIASRTNGTTVVLSAATTATATGVTFRILNRNPYNLGAPVGLVTAAQDAAGSPTTVKFTYDVPNGSQVEFDVYSVYTSLQYGNLTARTFPEQVEAYLRVADALHARVAETQMLDVMTAWSTLVTGAKTFGTARQLLAQLDHLAAFYRNLERMRAQDPLVVGVPAWAINAMRGDYVSTFLGDGWGLSNDELISFFAERNLMPYLYLDGPSDISQLFSTTGLSAAVNTGTNSATPIAIPDYPGTGATTSFRTKVVSFVYAPGTFINGTTGELNLGLVRDSILNSQNRFRNFMEEWETPAFVGTRALRCVHTVAADGTYGAAASITLGAGAGI